MKRAMLMLFIAWLVSGCALFKDGPTKPHWDSENEQWHLNRTNGGEWEKQ
jgi:hypothetical protein